MLHRKPQAAKRNFTTSQALVQLQVPEPRPPPPPAIKLPHFKVISVDGDNFYATLREHPRLEPCTHGSSGLFLAMDDAGACPTTAFVGGSEFPVQD